MKPQALKKGDRIGIAASSSPFDKKAFEQGVNTLQSLGFKVHYRQDIFEKSVYLAGSDKRRSEELIELIENPEIKAILFARGGYGMMRILPYLDRVAIKSSPKIVLGYSDITPLLIYLNEKKGWPTFYGPVVAKDLSQNAKKETIAYLLQALTSTNPLSPFKFEETICLQEGIAQGPMTGGCLSLLCTSLGTPFEIQTDHKILFIEDTHEKPYEIDRMLTHLAHANKFKNVKGILFGNMIHEQNKSEHFKETIQDVLADFKGPILFNFPAGHGPLKVSLPLGIMVELNASQKTLTYKESALDE